MKALLCYLAISASPETKSESHCISNPAFQFPEVAQVEQPPKTSESLESWALGNTGPFFQKPF
jgi:hypothetical protein